jgi:hypothetical protein
MTSKAVRERAEKFFKPPSPDECSAARQEYKTAQDALREKMAAQKAARLAREAEGD